MAKAPGVPREMRNRYRGIDHGPEGVILPTRYPEELLRMAPALAAADALLNGQDVADERLRVRAKRAKAMPHYKPGEEPTLADKFIASTYTLGATAKLAKSRKIIDEIMLQQRVAMRKAHRFVLDKAFVEHATVAAMVESKKLLPRLQFATLPYETTWIEFDLPAKIRVLRELIGHPPLDMTDIPQRLGILLQRIDDTLAVATLVSETGDTADMHLLSHYFSTVERTNWPPFHGHEPLMLLGNRPQDDAVLQHANGGMWGYTDNPSAPVLATMAEKRNFNDLYTPEFLQRHGQTATGPMFRLYREAWGDTGLSDDRLAALVQAEITEFTGHMRWLVTVLAMLNEVPIHTDLVMPSHQQRVGRTQKVKYIDYHKVTLRLPKIRPIPFIERHINGDVARRHRAHEVRAHWRTYLHAEHCPREEHVWEFDHENGYRLCGKCMAYSRLIHEHVRGDASLGWIRHDYVIKASKEHST